MKNLDEAKTIIGWEIIRELKAETLKIDRKCYIRNLLEVERMSLYYLTVFLMKVDLAFSLDQVRDHIQADLTIY